MSNIPYDIDTVHALRRGGHIDDSQYMALLNHFGAQHPAHYYDGTQNVEMQDRNLPHEPMPPQVTAPPPPEVFEDLAPTGYQPDITPPAPITSPVTPDVPQPVQYGGAAQGQGLSLLGNASLPNDNGAPAGPSAPRTTFTGSLGAEAQPLKSVQGPLNPMDMASQQYNAFYGPSNALQAKGITAQATAEANKGQETADAIFDIRDEDRRRQGELQNAQMEFQRKSQEAISNFQDHVNKVAAMKVDPGAFWANRSTPDKVLAGIGLFLGSFGTRGNQAADVITGAINRDIQAQEANIANARAGVATEGGLLSHMIDTYKSKPIALAASKAAMLQNAMLSVQGIAAKYSGPEAAGKRDMLLGQLGKEEANAKMQAAQLINQRLMQSPEYMAAANPQFLNEKDRERRVETRGKVYFTNSAKEGEDLRDQIPKAETGLDALEKLMAIGKNGKFTSVEDRNQAPQLAKLAGAYLRPSVFGTGSYKEGESHLLQEMIDNPDDWKNLGSYTGGTLAKLQTIYDTVNEGMERDKKSKLIGYKPLVGGHSGFPGDKDKKVANK